MSDYQRGQGNWQQSGQQPLNSRSGSYGMPEQPYGQNQQQTGTPYGYGQNTGGYIQPETDYAPRSPFDEPEEAPELRDSRSEHLYSRSEPFWNSVTNRQQAVHRTHHKGSAYTGQPPMMDEKKQSNQNQSALKRFLGSHATWKLIGLIAVLVVVAVLMCSALFEIRTIHVVGNTTVPTQTIIDLSGLKPGMLTLAMNHEKIAERVERNRYLQCTLVDVNWDQVTIHVHERTPMVYLDHNGILLTLDIQGYVLEETLGREGSFEGLIYATGMELRRSVLGQQIVTADPAQLSVYSAILLELKAMQALPMIKELDMSSMDSIYLKTHDGFDVRLGDASEIHQKLRAMTVVYARIPEINPYYTEGTIDVSHPAAPTYDPTDEIKALLEAQEEARKQQQRGQ